MSPMSRWSRNWTPLTTRPSRTSRQGMILAAGIDRLRKAQPFFPQGLAHDRAGRAGFLENLQVRERGDAARCLHRQSREALDDFGDQIAVRPGHHAVAADIGDEDVARIWIERERVPQA